MRILKIYFLLVLLVGISYGVVYLTISESNESNTASITNYEKGEILPQEKWFETLVGKWNVEFSVTNPNTVTDIEGITTFRKDSTFADAWQYKYFESDSPYDEEIRDKYNLKSSGNVIIEGNFQLKQNRGVEVIEKNRSGCSSLKTYKVDNYDFCKEIGMSFLLRFIGDIDFDNGNDFDLLLFTNDKIQLHMSTLYWSEPSIITYTRVKE